MDDFERLEVHNVSIVSHVICIHMAPTIGRGGGGGGLKPQLHPIDLPLELLWPYTTYDLMNFDLMNFDPIDVSSWFPIVCVPCSAHFFPVLDCL